MIKIVGWFLGANLLFGGFVIGLFYILKPHPPDLPSDLKTVEQLEAYLAELVNSNSPPGLSLIVIKKGKIVYQNGFGYADGPDQKLMTIDTVSAWYSITKIATAVGILQLHEQGRLNIDDPVSQYLPFFQIQYPTERSKSITIKHLLNHSSGIPNNIPEIFGWIHSEEEQAYDQTEYLKKVFFDYSKIHFEPGTKSSYTNVGYMILGAIIEKVSGKTYENYIRERILFPLKMKHTDFVYRKDMIPLAATGSHPVFDLITPLIYLFSEDNMRFLKEINDRTIWFKRFYLNASPPSGILGPISDTARFAMALLNHGELEDMAILAPETVQMFMHSEHLKINNRSSLKALDGLTQGLGWKILNSNGRFRVFHTGGGPGYSSMMQLYPDESLGIIIQANGTHLDRHGIIELIENLEW